MARSNVVRSLAVGSALAVALLASTRQASAWCRTTTEEGFEPTPDEPCSTTGSPLFWSSRCVGFTVQRDASPEQSIDLTTARALVKQAFDQWTNTDCPADPVTCADGDFTGTHPSVVVTDLGPVSCDKVEYNQKSGNANIIMFRDAEWPHPDADLTLALTTVTFAPETGEIYDADMEINSDPTINKVTIADDKVVYDLQSILTHETGHFLGMAHTQPGNTASTMYTRYKQGATFMRDISRDDSCGICAAYDPSRKTVCDTTPRRGLALGCHGNDMPDTKKVGCHCALVGDDRAGMGDVAAGMTALALSLGVARRRRRRHA
ncbi:MAG: matrixin family metalloprotease [Polyangiales bacterium]